MIEKISLYLDQKQPENRGMVAVQVNNVCIYYRLNTTQIRVAKHKPYGGEYCRVSRNFNLFDFIIHVQSLPAKKQIKFIHFYYSILSNYFRKKNNFKVLIPVIDMMEKALDIPEESRWSFEKLEEERKRES